MSKPTPSNGKQLRAGGYCRTSGEGQRDNTSIPNQKEAIEATCEANGWKLVRHYVDECKSGATTEGRDDFNRMLKDAANGQLDIIVPYDAKRFARDGVDIVNTAKTLKAAFGVSVVDSKGQFDNRDHRNALRNFVEAGVSEHERLTIMERMVGGRIKKAKMGLPWSAYPPFGRAFRSTGKNTGEWYVTDQGKAMEALLRDYLKGGSLRELVPQYGFTSVNHVQHLIHSAQLAARPYVATFDCPDIGIVGLRVEVPAVPPVISAEMFKRVLDRLLHNRTWNRQHLRRYVLGGFIRCAHCGYTLSANSAVTTSGSRRILYYRHRSGTGDGGKGCPFRSIPADAVEGPVLDYLYRWFVDQPAFDLAVRLALPSSQERESREDDLRQAEAELAKVTKQIANLVKAIADGADATLLIDTQAELKSRKEGLLSRLSLLRGELAEMPDPEAVQREADDIRLHLAAEQVDKDWRSEPYESIRRFLHFLFSDNPRKDNLGIFVNRKGGRWTVDIRARLRLRSPWFLMDVDGYAKPVGGQEGRLFQFTPSSSLSLSRRGNDLSPSASNG